MRLTLRTLLAYIDEVLPPAQAEEIGRKLEESPVGTSLVQRIQDVLRQKRLSSPTLSGSGMGIDPNAVAEYLDNTLAPDGIAAVERICLESDLHLAEVAGCHQILSLAVAEPAELPPKIRERMIALGPNTPRLQVPQTRDGTGLTSPAATAGALSSAGVSSILAQAPNVGTPDRSAAVPSPEASRSGAAIPAPPRSFEEGLPEYLRSGEKTRWWPYALAAVVLAGWGFLTFQSSPFGSRGTQATAPEVTAAGANADGRLSTNAVADLAVTTPAELTESGEPPMANPPAATAGQSTPPTDTQLPPDVENDPDVDAPPYRKQNGRNSNPPEGTKTAARGPSRSEEKPANLLSARYISTEGVAIAYLGDEDSWRVQPGGSVIPVGREFASPVPFEANLELPGWQFTLQPGGLLALTSPAKGNLPAVELRSGRLMVQPASNGRSEPTTLELHLTKSRWLVTLSGDAVLGLESTPPVASRFEQRAGVDPGRGALHLARGRADLVRLGDDEFAIELRGPASLVVPLERLADESPRPQVVTTWQNPDWLSPTKPTAGSRNPVALFTRSFKPDEAVEMTLPPLANDANPRLAEFATQCLALIGNVPELVKILKTNRHEEARRTAILGLRTWLVSDAGDPGLLQEELRIRYTAREAELVYKLLWGYSPADARSKTTSKFLVDLLSDPEVSLRALAIHHLKGLTGQDFNFQPNATELQRQSNIRQWRNLLRTNGETLLKPDPNAPADEPAEDSADQL
ncbi:MAG: hypothetical protein ACK6D3_02760 [Planctomycetaceae bacterium]|jgi:hypothetical protein